MYVSRLLSWPNLIVLPCSPKAACTLLIISRDDLPSLRPWVIVSFTVVKSLSLTSLEPVESSASEIVTPTLLKSSKDQSLSCLS